MGGMSALIPIKNDPVANEKALAGIRHDKTRDANDGFDGGWVATRVVPIAMEEFVKGARRQAQPVREAGRRQVRPPVAGLPPDHPDHRSRPAQQHQRRHPLPGPWLAGNGCVPIHNLMEDAATAEISRPRSGSGWFRPKGILDDGRKVTVEMVRPMIAEELPR